MRSRTFDSRWVVVALAAALALGAGAAGTGERWLRRTDEARPLVEGRMRLAVESGKAGRGAVDARIDLYVEASGRWLAVFRSGKQEGRRILARDGKFWLLVPGARNPVPVAGQQRLAGVVSVADLVGLDLSSRFTATPREATEPCDERTCRVADLVARSADAAYASGVLWIDQETELPARLRLRTPSGRDSQEIVFEEFRREGPRATIRRLAVRDLLRRGGETTTSIEVLETDSRRLDPRLFTLDGARDLP